jgi:beta-fructofuranosidase
VRTAASLLYYTGNVKHPGSYDYIRLRPRGQRAAGRHPDGERMGEKQLLLTNAGYPADCSLPRPRPEGLAGSGGWKMVLGARSRTEPRPGAAL